MLANSPQWVAIYTRSRAEKRVADLLSQSGFEHYLPIVKRRHKWSDRYKLVEEPLLRSYVFVRIKNTDVDKVRKLQGVCSIISFGGEVATIPEGQIDAVRRLVDADLQLTVQSSSALHKGAWVRIDDGPFAGLQGLLVSECKDGNFAVRIDAIGLSLVTTIDRLLLKPLIQKKSGYQENRISGNPNI